MTEEIAQTNIGSIDAYLPDASSEDEHSLADSEMLANESLKFESFLTKKQQEALAENSARVIQRAWRRHIAELLDGAAGVHVRFRLGGETFPPKIYYKIFTHRPIVDLCANSPKDYTHHAAKQKLPREIHNHNSVKDKEDDHSGWYKRLENNDWRSLSDKYLGTTIDYMEFEPNRKRATFHHCTLQRKQDIKRKQKQKKIEWMKKMYKEGMLQAQTLDPNTAVLVQRATEGLIDSVEQTGPNSILDWEVDELLEWTNALNFEKYLNDWTEIACSSSSAKLPGSSIFVSNLLVYATIAMILQIIILHKYIKHGNSAPIEICK
ncbi:protein MFI isoform X3 [Stegostoma tigrinum]|uniref:protein MFI isoform X3 n=1 Tax=Stegostoma tigrinum TaxID=3053191 RepID=UPI00202ADEDF|nr:protein MFI isoform X3 [Stegostoma tigrinum]